MIELRPRLEGVDAVVRQLSATPRQVDRALRITVNRMAGWLRRKAGREVSEELRVGLDVLRYRMRTLRRGAGGDRSASLWFGLNPIALTHMDPREVARGVKAGPAYVKGGFIAKGQAFKRRGKSRLPIERATMPIQEKADKALEAVVSSVDFERRFLDTFERELTRIWTRAST